MTLTIEQERERFEPLRRQYTARTGEEVFPFVVESGRLSGFETAYTAFAQNLSCEIPGRYLVKAGTICHAFWLGDINNDETKPWLHQFVALEDIARPIKVLMDHYEPFLNNMGIGAVKLSRKLQEVPGLKYSNNPQCYATVSEPSLDSLVGKEIRMLLWETENKKYIGLGFIKNAERKKDFLGGQ